MKKDLWKTNIWVILGALCLLPACGARNNRVVIKESYFHKYGVPIPKEDWVRNGKNGSVAELRSDGVTVTKHYENGILQGKSSYTFTNSSTIQTVEIYDKGELVAKTTHYLSGVPMKEEKFQGGILVALNQWYEDGVPSSCECYLDKYLVSGEYKTPLNSVESKVEEGNGTRIVRGSMGELISKDEIRDREMVERVTFFENGEPATVSPYKEGLIDGIRTTFFPGGLPKTREEWVEGKQEGITTLFQNGEKSAEVTYLNNEKHGVERRYHDGKFVVEEVHWKHNIQHGPRLLLAEDGSTLKTEWYLEGELVSRPTFERLNVR